MKKRINRKVLWVILSFLLLIPFRLPIGVIFINLVTYLANLAGDLSHSLLVANVVVTKIIYCIALSVISIYNVEMMSRDIKGRKPSDDMYWWTAGLMPLFLIYIIYDGWATYTLYYELLGLNHNT